MQVWAYKICEGGGGGGLDCAVDAPKDEMLQMMAMMIVELSLAGRSSGSWGMVQRSWQSQKFAQTHFSNKCYFHIYTAYMSA